jgi:hypothetical protein
MGDFLYNLLSTIGIIVFIFLLIQYVRWLNAEGLLGGIKLVIYAFIFLMILSNV